MTAARVLNPVILTEFCKLRASPSTMGRNVTCNRQLNRIKRDLFGPANPVETQKTFAEELDKHQEHAIKKWGFDFRNGSPLTTNTQFVWERISYQESTFAPEVYTLTRAAHVRPAPVVPCSADLLMDERAERENYMINTSISTDTDSCGDYDSQDESLVFKVPDAERCGGSGKKRAHDGSAAGRSPLRKRQPKITEYMKERKRLAQTPKKVSPAKRARTSSGSSSSHSHSTHAYSISAHFSLQRNLQRNN
ncbi:PREDICTED: cyclin-dependent kinase inhibitor 1B [Rhagoletis zephyria]|uniref:cyclin-dependent kinase inhibitor 1B n=1 Tax=Rhagoletis zephyria TaxID=28612 RepID=UPI00081153D9|nr:PREDICTED: cyclin-dependent kinase inhibitor 1B [Rhagoletis zephyria]XP_036332963.1 cyclin-dependent kinase inhibitor 1B [Rhagoletis pomonella]